MKTLKKIFNSLIWCFTDLDEHNWSYKLVAFLGILIRVIVLPWLIPDVFELIANFIVSQLHCPQWLYEILIRLILLVIDSLALSRIFYTVSFLSVGNSYESWSAPWWGSLCYTVYYTAYMAIPILLINYFQWLTIGLVFGTYALLCIGIYILSAVICTLPDSWLPRAIIHFVIFALIVTTVCLLRHFL